MSDQTTGIAWPPILNAAVPVRSTDARIVRYAARRFADIPEDRVQYDFLLFFPTFGEVNYGAGWRRNAAEMAPLGPLYLASPLLKAGYRVRFCDLNVEHLGKEELEELVRSSRIFGISFLTIQEESAKSLIRAIRAVRPDAFIIVGGHHCHLLDEPFAESDVTVTGEAEAIIVRLIRSVEHNEPLTDVPGLLFRADNGEKVRTAAPDSELGLEEFPRPARELVDPRLYGFLFGSQISRRIAGVMSSRGCVFNCSFCIRSPYPPYRDRSARDVVEELAELWEDGYDTVIMADEYFLTNRRRVIEIMDQLVMRGIKLRIIFQTRVNSVDDEIAKKLKAGGVFAILFGIETAAADVLKFYNKGATVERARKAIRAAHDAGIFTYGGFIIGAPVETREHLDENIRFVRSVPLDFVSFHHLVYMFGTPLWQEARDKGIVAQSEYWVEADSRFGGPSAEEIAEWRRTAFRKFYVRPGYVIHLARKCIRLHSGLLFKVALQFVVQTIRDGTRVSWIHEN